LDKNYQVIFEKNYKNEENLTKQLIFNQFFKKIKTTIPEDFIIQINLKIKSIKDIDQICEQILTYFFTLGILKIKKKTLFECVDNIDCNLETKKILRNSLISRFFSYIYIN
jgi:hypothetical protein